MRCFAQEGSGDFILLFLAHLYPVYTYFLPRVIAFKLQYLNWSNLYVIYVSEEKLSTYLSGSLAILHNSRHISQPLHHGHGTAVCRPEIEVRLILRSLRSPVSVHNSDLSDIKEYIKCT